MWTNFFQIKYRWGQKEERQQGHTQSRPLGDNRIMRRKQGLRPVRKGERAG